MNIFLKKLELEFRKETVVLEFKKFNYFYGQMGSGKSSIARLIDFCLGADLELTPALQNEFNSAKLYILVENNLIVIERTRESDQMVVEWDFEKEKVQTVIPARKSDGIMIPNTEIEVLSDLIFHVAGHKPPKVRKSKTDEDSDLQRLSIRNLLWYCYIDQEGIDSTFFHLDKEANWYKRNPSRDVLRFILGYHQEIVSELEMEIQKVRDKKIELRSAANALKNALESTGFQSELVIQSNIEELSEEKKTLEVEIEEIKNSTLKDSIPHGIERLKLNARKLESEISSLKTGIEEITEQVDNDTAHLHEVKMLRVKNNRSSSARAVLSGVEFEQCPRCTQTLPERKNEVCHVCGQQENLDSEGLEKQNEILEQDAKDRIDELDNLIERYQSQQNNMRNRLNKLMKEKQNIDSKINEAMSNYDSAYLSSVLVREKRISTVEQEIENLNNLLKLPQEAQKIRNQSVELHTRQQQLKEDLKEAREKAESDTENIQELERLFLDCLIQSKIPGISPNDNVSIASPWYLPEIQSPKAGELAVTSFSNLGSGGKKTLFKACFAIAVHRLANQTNAFLPKLLIIDSPMKNISERENREQFEGFHEFLYRISQDELIDTQIILIDKEFCETPEELNIEVNSRHMMPVSDEYPPLIPYYRGH